MNKRHVLVAALALSGVMFLAHAEDEAIEAAETEVEETTEAVEETTQAEMLEAVEVAEPVSADAKAMADMEESVTQEETPEPVQEEPPPEPAPKEAPEPTQEPQEATPEPQITPEQNMPEALSDEDHIGFRGNWVKKRQWLQRAMAENNRLQELVLAISEARMPYMQKYFTLDRELDAFYKGMGESRAKIKETAGELRSYLEELSGKLLAKAGDTETQEQAAYDLRNYAQEIDEFEENIAKLDEYEEALKKRIDRLDAQVAEAMAHSAKARRVYEEIWNIVDDKKAEANFYELQGTIGAKVQSIHDYVTGTLKADYDSVASNLQAHLTKLNDLVQKLESHDFIVTKRAERVEALKAKAVEPVQTTESDEPGFLARVGSWFKEIFATPYRWVFGA